MLRTGRRSRPLRADVAQLVAHHLAKVRVAGSNPVIRSKVQIASIPAVEWPSGEATACKAVHTGSIPVSTSRFVSPARLAQRESASLTRKRSLVQSQYRAPQFEQFNMAISRPRYEAAVAEHLVARVDDDAADLPRRCQLAALPVLRPAAMSDEPRGGSGGFGGAFVLLIAVGAILKFWVWIAVAFGAAVLFGLLLRGGVLHDALGRLSRACAHCDRGPRGRAARARLSDDDRGIYAEYVPTQIIGHFP